MDLQKLFEVNYVNPILVALCYPLSNISEFKIIYNAVFVVPIMTHGKQVSK